MKQILIFIYIFSNVNLFALDEFKNFSEHDLQFRGENGKFTYILNWHPLNKKSGQVLFQIINDDKIDKYEFKKVGFQLFSKFLKSSNNKIGKIVLTDHLKLHTLKNGKTHYAIKAKVKGSEITLSLAFDIASINTLNHWDGDPNNTAEEQMYIYDIFRPSFSNWYDPKIQRKKADNLILQIKLLKLPEVIALQELESAGNNSKIFEEKSYLRNELLKLGYYYFYVGKQDPENPVALTTGFISKYEMKNERIPFNVHLKDFKDFSKREKKIAHYTTRDMQALEFEFLGTSSLIVNNHWRSQGCSNERSCSMSRRIRKANQDVLLRYVDAYRKKSKTSDIILLGDFNTEYWQENLTKIGGGLENKVQAGDQKQYYNLWYELAPKDRWEVSHKGRYGTLSHILIGAGTYDNRGIQYVDNSFKTLAQDSFAQSIILNADENPFRWQEKRFKPNQIDASKKNKIKKLLSKRKCKKGSYHKRCRILYHEFPGEGFSDHIPLYASFNLLGDIPLKYSKTKFKPSSTKNVTDYKEINIPFAECDNKSVFIDLIKEKINLQNKINWFKKCTRLSFKEGLEFKMEGLYKTNYIEIGDKKIFVTMMHSYDPRAVEKGKIRKSKSDSMNPLSNMCYARRVLQGSGGRLKSVVGRLGIHNGDLAIIASKREDIELSDLPRKKRVACLEEKLDMDY